MFKSMSRLDYIENKYNEWCAYLDKYGMQPIRVYISHNYFSEMIDEVASTKGTGLFTECVFNNRQGVRVYKGYPLILVQDSNYFIVEGCIKCTSLTSKDTKTIATV